MDISVVIPFLNEQENLKPLIDELEASFDPLAVKGKNYEFGFIDDGSSDSGPELLRREYERNPRIKMVEFRRNFGQTAATVAGLDYCEGDVVITMDVDRQNDPADIPTLLEKLDEGFDMVTVKFLLSYSGRPLHFFGIPGLICASAGFIIAVYLAIERLFSGMLLSDRPLFLFALVLVLPGVQFVIFGLLGELQIRTYYESENKPIYYVRSEQGEGVMMADEPTGRVRSPRKNRERLCDSCYL